jgi:hypothetical protein
MIKNWKLFLESKDPFEGDPFREEILNNVDDILAGLNDEGIYVKYSYGIDDVSVFPGTKPHNEFKFIFHCNEKDYIDSKDFEYIEQMHSYLTSEDFEPISDNILKELDVQFHIKNKILSYPISRMKHAYKSGEMDRLRPDWIRVSYRLPFEKWRGNYVSKK